MAGLTLKTISYMADKFPDKWMEKIPYYRPQDEVDEKSRRSKRSPSRKHSRRSSRREYRDDRYYDDEETESDLEGYGYSDRRGHYRSKSVGGRRYDDPVRSSRPRSYVPADYVPQASGTQPTYPMYNNMGYNTAPPPVAPEASPTRAAYRAAATPEVSPTRAAYRAAATPEVSPTRAAYRENSPTKSTSGPIPGYMPYAGVYQGRRGPPRDQGYPDPTQRDAAYYFPGDRQYRHAGSRAESRSSRRYDGYYESDRRDRRDYHDYRGYDSEGDAAGSRRRSRRHHRY